MKRPLMGAGIALVAGTAAALFGVPGLWVAITAAVGVVCLMKWTECSLIYALGLSVFLFVGFCRGMSSTTEVYENFHMEEHIRGEVWRVQQKSKSTYIYVKTDEKFSVLVTVACRENEEKRQQEYYKGQVIQVVGRAEALDTPSNPGQFDAMQYYGSQGIMYRLRADEISMICEGSWIWRKLRFLEKLKGALFNFYGLTMSEDGAGVVQAAVLGDRSGFQEDLRRYYQQNGWMHLVTTSGLHLSFIAMGLYRRLRKSTVPVLPSTVTALLLMMAYGYMTDFGDSMLRAMGMMVFLLVGRLLGRKMDVPTALVLTADVLLLLRPERLFLAGFQLSFGAVAGMEVGRYIIKYWRNGEKKQKNENADIFKEYYLKKISEILWVQIGIFLVTLPILLWHMYEVPLMGFFYNFFMIPLVSVIVPAVFAAGLIGISHIPILAGAAMKVMWGIDWLLKWIHKLPSCVLICGKPQWRQIFLFCIFVFISLWILRRKQIGCKKFVKCLLFAGILIVGCFILMFVRERSDQILCMDVGQGDGICILGEDGEAILVDGGSSDVKKVYQYRIEPLLKYYGVRKIDAWFLTHGDFDHVSGIEEALSSCAIPVRQVILPDIAEDETLDEIRRSTIEKNIPVRIIRPEDQLTAGNFRLTCLYPKIEWGLMDKNNNSLVLVLSRKMGEKDFRMLFMGDLESEGEALLLEKKGLPDCDVLKVGHHGSSRTTSMHFLKAVMPEWAFISCGADNRYGHPHAQTLERLDKAGCQYLTTARQGALILRIFSGDYQVMAWKKKRKY